MIKSNALFINGVFEAVLQEILQVQSVLPEHIMFLQPYKAQAMTVLQRNPPTIDTPLPLYMSLTDDLTNVHYQAEIVGWDDKRNMLANRKQVISQLINALQPGEVQPNGEAVYNASKSADGESVNLLHIRRLRQISQPFSVSRLRKVSDSQLLSTNRTQSGGWSYVILEPVP